MVVILFVPIGMLKGLEESTRLFMSDLGGLTVYAIILAAVNFIAIFLYKNLTAQAILGWVSVLASVVFQFVLIRQVDTYVDTIREASVTGGFSWGTLFPLITIAILLVGLRKVHGESAEIRQPLIPEE